MSLSRRTNTIILWVVSIGLLIGMIITFTPTLGALTGSGPRNTSAPALIVNGETISELDVAQARRSSALFNVVQEGPVAVDLEMLLVDSLVRQEVVRQAAARQRVGNAEVRAELAAFRERNGVAGSRNDEAYLRLIGGAGYDDASFRDYLRGQLQIQKWEQEILDGIDVSDEEVASFYRVNRDAYRTEPRVRARQIVVSDAETAAALRDRALAGASFAELAAEASEERAEQGGAVGGDEPQPVGRPAFPSAVAEQVFARTTPGVTPVVQSGGRSYLVAVEELVPAEPRPLEEVADEVREDALAAKQQALLDRRVSELVEQAEVQLAEASELSLDDPVVAKVGDSEIRASQLVRATYTNPQIQQALNPQSATLIAEFFKPSVLEQLIDRELAVQGAERLDATFFGSDALVAQSALDWVAREAEASQEEIISYYQANPARYTVPASAEVLRIDFVSLEAAVAYRDGLLEGADPQDSAESSAATVQDLGVVREGDLAGPLDTALFATDAFQDLPAGELAVSDVLVLETSAPEGAAEDGSQADDAGEGAAADAAAEVPAAAPATQSFVVLVADRTPERIRPLSEVRRDVAATVLAQERQLLQRAWLDGLREEIEVENLLTATRPAPATNDAGDDAAVGDDDGQAADGSEAETD